MEIIIHILFSYFSTITFAIITNIPRKALNACGITGTVGWMLFYFTKNYDTGEFFAVLVGAVGIGIMSTYFSRKKRLPMILFNIPSLVPLVPGGPAYQAVRNIVLGHYELGFLFMLKVVLTAGAITAGFMVTGIIERLLKKVVKVKEKAV